VNGVEWGIRMKEMVSADWYERKPKDKKEGTDDAGYEDWNLSQGICPPPRGEESFKWRVGYQP
jgi:hypothetical protein